MELVFNNSILPITFYISSYIVCFIKFWQTLRHAILTRLVAMCTIVNNIRLICVFKEFLKTVLITVTDRIYEILTESGQLLTNVNDLKILTRCRLFVNTPGT